MKTDHVYHCLAKGMITSDLYTDRYTDIHTDTYAILHAQSTERERLIERERESEREREARWRVLEALFLERKSERARERERERARERESEREREREAEREVAYGDETRRLQANQQHARQSKGARSET